MRSRAGDGRLTALDAIAAVFGLLAMLGCLYSLAAVGVVWAVARAPAAPEADTAPSVTILKPLYGDEPRLAETLASFCRQDYPGPVEIVFGVQRPDDPARAVAEAVIADHPGVEARVVCDERRWGQNGKVSNLVNMSAAIRHEVVVMADSDMLVGPRYLREVAGALAVPGVGLVSCLYRGVSLPALPSRLAAAGIDAHFLPSVLVGLALRLARPCFGSTIALRRDTLERLGGFNAFRDVLADDNAIGEAVRALGLHVLVPARPVLGHVCAQTGWAALLRQDLRWARTIKAVDPGGFAGSIVTNPLPLAIIACGLAGFRPATILLLVATLACRRALQLMVGHYVRAWTPFWIGPLRDLVSFAVFIASFWPGSLDWRGHSFAVASDGTMTPPGETGP